MMKEDAILISSEILVKEEHCFFCIRMDVPFLLHELVYTKTIMEVGKSGKKGYNNVK